MKYHLSIEGGQLGETTIEADDLNDAISDAKEWTLEGEWDRKETSWVNVDITAEDGTDERISVTIEPEEPKCANGHEHEWCSPYSVVGGIKENPGVYGHGGGVVITQMCRHCGTYRVHDTWAQRSDTGEQGLDSIEYRPADEVSLRWVLKNDPDPDPD